MLETIWEDELEGTSSSRESETTDDDEDDFTLCVRTSTHDGSSLDFSFKLPRTSHARGVAAKQGLRHMVSPSSSQLVSVFNVVVVVSDPAHTLVESNETGRARRLRLGGELTAITPTWKERVCSPPIGARQQAWAALGGRKVSLAQSGNPRLHLEAWTRCAPV
ncbi:hypothetical protein MRX96_041610 [Rhipicephalus microplus]